MKIYREADCPIRAALSLSIVPGRPTHNTVTGPEERRRHPEGPSELDGSDREGRQGLERFAELKPEEEPDGYGHGV